MMMQESDPVPSAAAETATNVVSDITPGSAPAASASSSSSGGGGGGVSNSAGLDDSASATVTAGLDDSACGGVSEAAAVPAREGVPCGDPSEAGASAAATEGEGSAQGILGRLKERVGNTVERVADLESVQKVVDKAKVVTQKVAESERVQQSVEFVKRKTTELAESERVQKGLELAKDTAKVVTEKTQQGLEFAKEKTQAVREGVGSVWQKGRGTIQKVRLEGVSAIAWRGSARDTLEISAREEQFKNIKVQGAEELSVPARTEHTCAYIVPKGSTLRWTFRVKDYDIGFGVRMRVQQWGGAKEEEILSTERYDNADTISGSWVADEDRTIILAFDNRYSKLRSKTVAYLVGTEKPPVFVEPPKEATAEPASEGS